MNVVSLQFAVIARDLGRVQRTSVAAPVTIDITRNTNGPVFTQDVYTAFVNEDASVGTSVLRATANDADTTVSIYNFCYKKH